MYKNCHPSYFPNKAELSLELGLFCFVREFFYFNNVGSHLSACALGLPLFLWGLSFSFFFFFHFLFFWGLSSPTLI